MPIATLTRSLTVVMLAAAVTISLAHEHEKGGPAASLRGEVLDLACFVSHGSRGADHVACAKKCVMGGQPMGLLTDSGAVWVLFADHNDSSAYDKVKQFAGKMVEITGPQVEKSGLRGVTVESVRPL